MSMQKTGKFIRAARSFRQLSPEALAEKLSVSTEVLSLWENGKESPSIGHIRQMAEIFGCPVSDILNGVLSDETFWNKYWPNLHKEIVIPEESYHAAVDLKLDLSSEKTVSALLFGDNLEHTRDCVNSGISAQMLKNRKFVSKPTRCGCAMQWYPIGSRTSFFFGRPYTRHGEGYRMSRVHECNSQVITNYFDETAGIGQKDIFLRGGKSYDFTFVAKAFTPTDVTVTLRSAQGSVYDSAVFRVEADSFTAYSAILHPTADDAAAHLEITFSAKTTITVGAVSLMPSHNFHGMRWDVIEKMKEMGTRLLRWPGGNFAGEYHWKDGFLPRDQRAPFQSWLWLETQPHTMGYDFHEINTDDFLALCAEIGAEPFITLNPTWNTPEDSAQWVEYCNGAVDTPYGSLRAQRGHPEPYNVKFWSLGNEFGYGHMEGANTPYDYARGLRVYAEKMLEVTPGLTICSSGPYPDRAWSEHAANPLANLAGVVSLHHYAEYPEFIDPALRKAEYYRFINKVYTESMVKLRRTRELLQNDSIQISYDEWNTWYAWYRRGSVAEGIYAAGFLNELLRHAESCGVSMACHFESVNEGALLVTPDKVIMCPTGRAIAVMSRHAGGQICALEQDAVATRKDGLLTLTFINRSFDHDKVFRFPEAGEAVRATLYTSDDVVPCTVFEEKELPLRGSSSTLEAVLPPHSIALVQLKLG